MKSENVLCDIIIPVWNNPDITKDCVESVLKWTGDVSRIIIIDNASDEPARNYIQSLRGKKNITVIRNDQNQGFVKAVNQGMRNSRARYIAVLNNDTLVTEGWLSEIVSILEKENDIGIANPSSNTFNLYPGKMSLDEYSRSLKASAGCYQELSRLRGFAMVIKREVLDKIGYLDEIYGLGYYDDTDYGMRAQKAGYRVVMAKASYVHHRESRSFEKVKEKTMIFLDNEKKFVSRWGQSLRIAFLVGQITDIIQKERLEEYVNRKARDGDQLWLFSTRNVLSRLKFIEHENIRIFFLPRFMIIASFIYKIIKRRKKKKIDVVMTNDKMALAFLLSIKTFFGADAVGF